MRDVCNLSLLHYILVLEGITRLYLSVHAQLQLRRRAGGRSTYARDYTSEIVELFNTGDIDHRGHAIRRPGVAESNVKFNPVT